jgi:hypothetical protein
MEPRKPINEYVDKAKVILVGTGTGAFLRWVTWPFERSFYDASQKNSPPYLQIYRNNFQPKALLESNKMFMKTGLMQTILKSASNIGVMNYIDYKYPNDTANQKSFRATLWSTPLETLLTSPGELEKVHSFLKKKKNPYSLKNNPSALFSSEFRRAMSATFVRVLWSGIITFSGIYKTTELIQPLFSNQDSAYAKPTAAFISSFMLQPIIMPIINYQTYILNDTSIPLVKNTKNFLSEHRLREFCKGSFGRGIHRSLYYGLTFLITEQLKHYWESDKSRSFEDATLHKNKP